MNCPALTITFLGTGTSGGVPMIACNCQVCASADAHDKRLRSSILVQSKTTSFIIDCGPDFRTQMLRESVQQLDAVLITHSHKDHIAGLDDVRAFNFFSGNPMNIYASAVSIEALKREFYYAFQPGNLPGIPQFTLHEIAGSDIFYIGDIPVMPVHVLHHKMPVLGFRIGKFTYITDANFIEPHEAEKIKNSQVLVLNALRKQKHISHFTLNEAIALAKESHATTAYFTHISHQMGLHSEVSAELPENNFLAFDGLKLFFL